MFISASKNILEPDLRPRGLIKGAEKKISKKHNLESLEADPSTLVNADNLWLRRGKYQPNPVKGVVLKDVDAARQEDIRRRGLPVRVTDEVLERAFKVKYKDPATGVERDTVITVGQALADINSMMQILVQLYTATNFASVGTRAPRGMPTSFSGISPARGRSTMRPTAFMSVPTGTALGFVGTPRPISATSPSFSFGFNPIPRPFSGVNIPRGGSSGFAPVPRFPGVPRPVGELDDPEIGISPLITPTMDPQTINNIGVYSVVIAGFGLPHNVKEAVRVIGSGAYPTTILPLWDKLGINKVLINLHEVLPQSIIDHINEETYAFKKRISLDDFTGAKDKTKLTPEGTDLLKKFYMYCFAKKMTDDGRELLEGIIKNPRKSIDIRFLTLVDNVSATEGFATAEYEDVEIEIKTFDNIIEQMREFIDFKDDENILNILLFMEAEYPNIFVNIVDDEEVKLSEDYVAQNRSGDLIDELTLGLLTTESFKNLFLTKKEAELRAKFIGRISKKTLFDNFQIALDKEMQNFIDVTTGDTASGVATASGSSV